MVGEPDAHGLSGHLKHIGHIVDELAVLTASPELVEAPLDLGDFLMILGAVGFMFGTGGSALGAITIGSGDGKAVMALDEILALFGFSYSKEEFYKLAEGSHDLYKDGEVNGK